MTHRSYVNTMYAFIHGNWKMTSVTNSTRLAATDGSCVLWNFDSDTLVLSYL
jgi:hypothetical protein